jgi:hypothetical protein
MTYRFWTICGIPLLPMGAAAVVLLMTLLGERAAEKPEPRMVVIVAQSFHPPPRPRTRTTGIPATFERTRALGTGRSLQSEVR